MGQRDNIRHVYMPGPQRPTLSPTPGAGAHAVPHPLTSGVRRSAMHDIFTVACMARSLRGVDLDNRSARAAAYIGVDIDPEDIDRLDTRAVASETVRRALFPAPDAAEALLAYRATP